MKILYMIHSLTIGGAETIVTNYLIQLNKAGQEVVLLQMYDRHTFLNQKLEQAGVRVLTVSEHAEQGKLAKGKAVWKLRRLLAQEKPDVIHVHTGLEKFRYISYPPERIVYTVHSEWSRCIAQGKNHRRMLYRLLQKGMSVVVLSEQARQTVRAQFPDARVVLIPNGFDFRAIREMRCDRSELLQKLHIPEDSFLVGHVGRFHKVKNHEKLIGIFTKVAEKRPDAQLLLVGSGDAGERKRVEGLAEKSGVADRIHLLGERPDAAAVMSALDCLVLPSYSEAFPLVLIEAQTLGIRAVVSTGIPAEVCANDNCLQLSLEESPDRWAEYVLGKQTVKRENRLDRFEIGNVIGEHLKLYRRLVQGDQV